MTILGALSSLMIVGNALADDTSLLEEISILLETPQVSLESTAGREWRVDLSACTVIYGTCQDVFGDCAVLGGTCANYNVPVPDRNGGEPQMIPLCGCGYWVKKQD